MVGGALRALISRAVPGGTARAAAAILGLAMTNPLPRNRRTAAFERRVARALEATRAFEVLGQPLVVACSGGPDSTATLIAVARAASKVGHPLVAATFDHRLRARDETKAEAAFVRHLAGTLDVGFRAGAARSRTHTGSEAAARNARYRWLARVARQVGARDVVTGHTLDDQAETVLLRLTRGSSLRGLAAMTPRSPWPVRGGTGLSLLRPLLGVSRIEVQAYLDAVGVQARHDASNNDLDYARNRVRHRVMPELRRLNPRSVEALARFATMAGRDEDALEVWARLEGDRLVRLDGRRALEIDRAGLRALPPAVALRVLRGAAERLAIAVDAAHLEAMWAASTRKGRRIALPGATFAVETGFVRMQRSP